jgi:hypothetical protein
LKTAKEESQEGNKIENNNNNSPNKSSNKQLIKIICDKSDPKVHSVDIDRCLDEARAMLDFDNSIVFLLD